MRQRKIADSIHDLHELRVALSHRIAQLGRVDIHVVEEATQVRLGATTPRRVLDVSKDAGQSLVEILIGRRARPHVAKQVGGTDKEPLLPDDGLTLTFRICIAQGRIVEGISLLGASTFGQNPVTLRAVHVIRQILRDEAVEQESEDVALEVPPIHAAAQVIGDAPDRLMQLRSLDHCRHYALDSITGLILTRSTRDAHSTT